MSEETPVKTQNIWAAVSVGSALVGFLIMPIILAPLAVIAGFVGNAVDGKPNTQARVGIIMGFCEICYLLYVWQQAGILS